MPVRSNQPSTTKPAPVVKEVTDTVITKGDYSVTVRIRVTKQLAPYETLQVEYGATAPLNIDEYAGQITASLEKARDLVLEQMLVDLTNIKNAVQ